MRLDCLRRYQLNRRINETFDKTLVLETGGGRQHAIPRDKILRGNEGFQLPRQPAIPVLTSNR